MKAPKTRQPATVNTLIPKALFHFTTRPFHIPPDQDREDKKENKTGLPDRLKAGIENLSNVSLDDVRVHHHSTKPRGIGAKAFAQGTDIYVASGEEHTLPHEVWHVVQQKQGRVRSTTKINRTAVNNDLALENEANEMADKARRFSSAKPTIHPPSRTKSEPASKVAQLSLFGDLKRKWKARKMKREHDLKSTVTGAIKGGGWRTRYTELNPPTETFFENELRQEEMDAKQRLEEHPVAERARMVGSFAKAPITELVQGAASSLGGPVLGKVSGKAARKVMDYADEAAKKKLKSKNPYQMLRDEEEEYEGMIN